MIAFQELSSQISLDCFIHQSRRHVTRGSIIVGDQLPFQRTCSRSSRNTISKDHFTRHRVNRSSHILARITFPAVVNGKHIFVLKHNAPQRCRFGYRTAALTQERVQNIKLIRAIAIRTNILSPFILKTRELAMHSRCHGGGSRRSCRRRGSRCRG